MTCNSNHKTDAECESHFFVLKRVKGNMYMCYSKGAGSSQQCMGSLLQLAAAVVEKGAKLLVTGAKAIVTVVAHVGGEIIETVGALVGHDNKFEALDFGEELLHDMKLGIDITTNVAKASFNTANEVTGNLGRVTGDQFNKMINADNVGDTILGAGGMIGAGVSTGLVGTASYVGAGTTTVLGLGAGVGAGAITGTNTVLAGVAKYSPGNVICSVGSWLFS